MLIHLQRAWALIEEEDDEEEVTHVWSKVKTCGRRAATRKLIARDPSAAAGACAGRAPKLDEVSHLQPAAVHHTEKVLTAVASQPM